VETAPEATKFLDPRAVEALATELAGRRVPHVLATVVWVRPPSSARTGQKAILDASGVVAGWVGGSCAQPIVAREAALALRDGASRLVTIGRDGEFADVGHGQVLDRMTCGSQGSIQVFLEARLPRTRLVVVGDAPVAEALLGMGRLLGYETVAVLKGGGSSPQADRVVDSLDAAQWPVDAGTYVVVATRNRYDRDAVKAALTADAGYVALVCSRKRASGLPDALRAAGFDEERIGRVHAPAGLDLGSIGEREIAVAILAEIVGHKARAARPEEALVPRAVAGNG
jgi:xanthine dehydrogenase accessory factor